MTGYVPTEGEILTVALPHEFIRATVAEVLNRNTILADLNLAHPFTRLHGYAFGQRLKFRRKSDVLGEQWALVEGQDKAPLARSGPLPYMAPPDEPEALPERPVAPQKAKRRSDVEQEKKARGRG